MEAIDKCLLAGSAPSSTLLLHDLLHALLNLLCLAAASAPTVNARRHTGDNAHEVIHQVIVCILRKDYFQPSPLHR